MCTITTVIYKDFYLILVDNYIYISKYILYHYTWWFKCQNILHLV